MSDYTKVDPDWAANYERANKLAADYAAKEGHPGGSEIYRVAMSSLTRSYPSVEDKKNSHWTAFWDLRAGSENDRAEWEAAEEKRVRWNRESRELTARNAKAESDRVAARDAEVQAKKDAELAALIEEKRARWLTLPGGTEESFKTALPGLLDDHRRQLMTEASTADDLALEAHRAAFRI